MQYLFIGKLHVLTVMTHLSVTGILIASSVYVCASVHVHGACGCVHVCLPGHISVILAFCSVLQIKLVPYFFPGVS